jgi:hypothetical protein
VANIELDRTPTASEEAENTFASPDEKRKQAEVQTIRESNLDLRMNRKLRWKYARWVFCYLVSYSCFVGLLLLASGANFCGFTLSEDVLSFLVGSTAASAIGLVLAVTTGLFKPLK